MALNPSDWLRSPVQLASVEQVPNPWGKPKATGAKAAGLRFERALGNRLTKAGIGHIHTPFFAGVLTNGRRFLCSPDFLISTPFGWLILEVKLSSVHFAKPKLDNLYRPVCEAAGLTIWGTGELVKYLKPGFETTGDQFGPDCYLQWLGGLYPIPRAPTQGV